MTAEQAEAFEFLRKLAGPGRWKVIADDEGWPLIRGRVGDLEWHDRDWLALYTAGSAQRRGRLLSLPGIRRHQVGDAECRVLIPVDRFEEAAGVIQGRRRKVATPEQRQALAEGRARAREARESLDNGQDSGAPTPSEDESDQG